MGASHNRAKRLAGVLLALIGVLGLVVAVVNLFNVDAQPGWIVATIAMIGAVLVGLGARLVLRRGVS
jgi:hypothetical protein